MAVKCIWTAIRNARVALHNERQSIFVLSTHTLFMSNQCKRCARVRVSVQRVLPIIAQSFSRHRVYEAAACYANNSSQSAYHQHHSHRSQSIKFVVGQHRIHGRLFRKRKQNNILNFEGAARTAPIYQISLIDIGRWKWQIQFRTAFGVCRLGCPNWLECGFSTRTI